MPFSYNIVPDPFPKIKCLQKYRAVLNSAARELCNKLGNESDLVDERKFQELKNIHKKHSESSSEYLKKHEKSVRLLGEYNKDPEKYKSTHGGEIPVEYTRHHDLSRVEEWEKHLVEVSLVDAKRDNLSYEEYDSEIYVLGEMYDWQCWLKDREKKCEIEEVLNKYVVINNSLLLEYATKYKKIKDAVDAVLNEYYAFMEEKSEEFKYSKSDEFFAE